MYLMSTFGRFHAMRAAEALARRGVPVELQLRDLKARSHTVRVRRGGLRGFGLAALARLVRSAGVQQRTLEYFDAQVARMLRTRSPSNTVLHGFAVYCEASLRAARQCGIACAVERSGAHAEIERQLLAEERVRLGVKHEPTSYYESQCALDRMLAEYELADKIIVSSTFCRDTFVAKGVDPQRLEVVGLAGNFQVRPWRPRPVEPFSVLSIGNQPELKGMFDLLKAWEIARIDGGVLRLRSPIPTAWKSWFAPRTFQTTELLPQVEQERLHRYYSNASVFCLLSLSDGFGLVVAEAMSFGCPVIVTKNVGASDLVTDGEDGFVVDIRRPDQVAEKLLYLKEHPEALQEMSRRALEKAQQVTWDRYAAKLLDMWSKVPHATTHFS